MGYSVELLNQEGVAVEVSSHHEGSNIILGEGNLEADITVTYNYSKHFGSVLIDGGLSYLDGKRAGDVIDDLQAGVTLLGTEQDNDYWKATPGNAGHILSTLLTWAKSYPNATFQIN